MAAKEVGLRAAAKLPGRITPRGNQVRIAELHVSGYRSIRDLRLPLGDVNVLIGPNGSGKTNLYRSVQLLAAAARGQLARSIALEGGMGSVLWAGARKKGAVRMVVEVELEHVSYQIACGLPQSAASQPDGSQLFMLDPQVKEERVWIRSGKSVTLLERGNQSAWVRDHDGRRAEYPLALLENESVLAQLAEPHLYPELSALRQEFLAWRFYHQFRTDPDSPLRSPQIGVSTPVLSEAGEDLAAALATILAIGDGAALEEAVDDAFPGSSLEIQNDGRGRLGVALLTPGIPRPFEARELSDGTLRYLCLLAALESPRPAPLLAFNEPETSLHPDLLEPLATALARSSRRSQLWITTHSPQLAKHLEAQTGISPLLLEKQQGETRLADRVHPGSGLP
jgi:predicted ATPase